MADRVAEMVILVDGPMAGHLYRIPEGTTHGGLMPEDLTVQQKTAARFLIDSTNTLLADWPHATEAGQRRLLAAVNTQYQAVLHAYRPGGPCEPAR
jgi:hypothetical protein